LFFQKAASHITDNIHLEITVCFVHCNCWTK